MARTGRKLAPWPERQSGLVMNHRMPRTTRPSNPIAPDDIPGPPINMNTTIPALQSTSAQVIFRQFRNLSMAKPPFSNDSPGERIALPLH